MSGSALRWRLLLLLIAPPALLLCLNWTLHSAPPADGGSYLFCFWNTEDLFDDVPEERPRVADREPDKWFAEDAKARKQKYSNLANVLVGLNGGKGPDILAVAEVESERAAELLAAAMNERLRNPALHYKNIAFMDPKGGRHIATAVITRLPIVPNRTQLHGNRLRILETHINVNGYDLGIIASHWTSRVSDQEGEGRDKYANIIYEVYKTMYRTNPKVEVLICGDFNDNPDDDSVLKHLHAISDENKVLRSRPTEPLLLNVFGKRWEEIQKLGKKEGTHAYRGKFYIFDQIVVSPGMLNRDGWYCDVKTAEIVTRGDKLIDRKGAPLRFGGPREKVPLEARGCSDHLPVTVRLSLPLRK